MDPKCNCFGEYSFEKIPIVLNIISELFQMQNRKYYSKNIVYELFEKIINNSSFLMKDNELYKLSLNILPRRVN
jgi:hypothetical protein